MIAPDFVAALVATPGSHLLGAAPDDDISLWRVIAALVLCLLLAVAAAFVLRARGGNRPLSLALRQRRLLMVETLRLGRNADLCIVRCDGREWLIAVSQNGAAVLGNPEAHPPQQAISAP